MLLPNRVKHRKQHRGRMKGRAMRGNTICHGDFGLVALEPAWITNRQIEAARIAMTRYIKRGGQVWIQIFPDKPITAKPGMVIGRQGSNIELLKKDLKKLTDANVDINIQEIKQPDMDATLVAENIASQLERRIAFRRAMKQCVGRTMRVGAKGIKVKVGGRLGGAEIARSESYREGSIPLHTLRADIDYGTAEAHTTYGRIGVKVWIYKGEVLPGTKEAAKPAAKNASAKEAK